jgi:hypothetical protein
VLFHIIENVHKHKIEVKRTWHGVGEEEAEAGLDLGLEEARSATCRRGKDQDGYSVLAEDLADGGGATLITLGFALGFRGFQDGGGHIHNTGIGLHTLVMHGLT